MHSRLTISILMMPLLLPYACVQRTQEANVEHQDEMLSLLLPERVEIVEPFTRVRSFDEDERDHGIELLVRAVNALGNPGLMIVGTVRIELYEFVPAAADHKGKRLEDWTIDITDKKGQSTYWNRLTQMYEFHLKVNPERVPLASQYVLQITYEAPTGKRLFDEFVLRYQGPGSHEDFRRVAG